jgi:RNA polymerase sigma factor (sigma-70 family)
MDEFVVDGGEGLLHALWMGLLRTARIKGIPEHEAEDLVNDAILKAFEKFDPQRGGFAPFTRKVLENLIKNFWRGHRPRVPFEDFPEFPDPDDPHTLVEENEIVRETFRMAELIAAELDAEERELFDSLREVLAEQDTRAVSEAARRIGLTPQKGWDLFRRIQRRSNAVVAERAAPDLFHACYTESDSRESDYSGGSGAPPAPGGYEEFSASLSPEMREKIVALLSPEDLSLF